MCGGGLQQQGLTVVENAVRQYLPIVTSELARGEFPLPSELVLAVIQAESRGKAGEVNPVSGATGLMQIMPIALKDYNQRNNDSYVMADLRGTTEPSITIQLRVGIDLLAHYWKLAFKYLKPRLKNVQLEDLGPIASVFYVAGQGTAKEHLNKIERPTFAAIAKRYPTWNATYYARNVWNLTAEQNPVWDLDALEDWLEGKKPEEVKPDLIAKTPRNGFLLAILVVALASAYMKRG